VKKNYERICSVLGHPCLLDSKRTDCQNSLSIPKLDGKVCSPVGVACGSARSNCDWKIVNVASNYTVSVNGACRMNMRHIRLLLNSWISWCWSHEIWKKINIVVCLAVDSKLNKQIRAGHWRHERSPLFTLEMLPSRFTPISWQHAAWLLIVFSPNRAVRCS